MSDPSTAREQFAAWRDQVDNFYDLDPHLQSLVRHYGVQHAEEQLRRFGAQAAGRIDELATLNNRPEHLPRLMRFDGQGTRLEQVDHHPGYHEIGRLAYGTGAMGLYAEPGNELITLLYQYLLSHDGEAGHACPFACTAGLIKILHQAQGDHSAWLERLYDPDYDTHFHGAQFLTEVQGGSDVGANTVVATPAGDGSWRITGEKWFCSVIDAHLFVVTARPEGAGAGTRGLQSFAVPRTLEDGATNHFALRRLKDKLGTRSMASAEVDFEGAVAWPVSDFRTCVEIVLNTSRTYNAATSSGLMQRAWLEAWGYATHRTAFGQPILRFPAVARIVAKLRVEAYAARASTFHIAHLADRIARGEDELKPAWRMLVNLNKFWTSIVGTSCVRDAIEVLGGNGAIEEFSVLPRLLRDSVVCEAWEGSHNVLVAQALKDSRRYAMHEPMFELIEALGGASAELQRARQRWRRVLDMPEELAALHARDVAWDIRLAYQLAALRAEAAVEGSDPLLPTVIAHLAATQAPGYDPLDDGGLGARIEVLVG